MKIRLVPFAYGFRPFFLLAGIYAAVGMSAWLWMYGAGSSPMGPLPPHLWHGHEMLYGFIGAAVAGFLLTAVPNWTGSRGFAGAPLILLVVLWLLGRMAFVSVGTLPPVVLGLAELLFMPAVMAAIAPALFRARNRNRALLLVITLFWATDLRFVLALHGGDFGAASHALLVGTGVILFLVTIIGGRIVPAFTANALRARGIAATMRSSQFVERGVLAAMIAYVAVDVFAADGTVIAVVAAVAGALHLVRMAGWHGLESRHDPIVWILHVGYLWLPVGLMLRALFLAGGFAWAVHWQHALAAGAAATMVLAVMTRASLGHTGRPLSATPAIVVAYVSLILAVAVRVFGPQLLPPGYATIMLMAGALFVLTFSLFVVIYAPILLGPRVDGKAG
jgi:uncharacterized protein involved in response to NO